MSRKGYVIVALIGCILLAYVIGEHALIARFDFDFAVALHHRATEQGIVLARWISFAGSPMIRIAVGVLVAIGLLMRRESALTAGWVVALGGGGILDVLLKQLFSRARPSFDVMYVSATGGSFPSGHAMGAIILYGMLVYILRIYSRSRALNLGALILAVVLVAAIGISRLYLGVHYLSDVLGGYVIGAIWLMICISGVERGRVQ